MASHRNIGLRYGPAIARWGTVVMFFVLVQLAISVGWLNRFLIPFPSDVLLVLPDVIVEEDVFSYFLITLGEAFAAFVGLVVIGVPIGVLLARRSVLWAAWGTWIAGLAAAPIVLLYPLFLVVFGRGSLTIVMIALVTGLPPVILKTVEGVTGTRRVLVDVGRSFNLSQRQMLWKITLPSALPAIFLGLRLGLIYAIITIVAVEYLIALGGLGKLVGDLAERYDLAATYATIGFVISVSIIFFVLVERIEKWLRL